jgi:hypothetical protein
VDSSVSRHLVWVQQQLYICLPAAILVLPAPPSQLAWQATAMSCVMLTL